MESSTITVSSRFDTKHTTLIIFRNFFYVCQSSVNNRCGDLEERSGERGGSERGSMSAVGDKGLVGRRIDVTMYPIEQLYSSATVILI